MLSGELPEGMGAQRALAARLTQHRDVDSVLLATRDGSCLASSNPRVRHPELVAAMAAAVLSASETVAEEYHLPRAGLQFVIRAGGYAVVGAAVSESLLVLALLRADAAPDAADDIARAVRGFVASP